MNDAALVSAEDLVRDYALPRTRPFGPRPVLRALDHVSLTVTRGRSMGLIGESGSGKSTLARIVLALDRPTWGRVRIAGEDVFDIEPSALRRLRRRMQIVFQDPYASLDPRRSVGWSVGEPLAALVPDLSRTMRRERVAETLEAVGLSPDHASRYPHEFSGGQRQRIAIARALVTGPELIVADEPVSALDVSVQAQILNLVMDLQRARDVTFLFISHDLAVVRRVADRVAVMYLGRIVEEGPTEEVFAAPAHPYTALLLASVALPDPNRRRRAGAVPARDTPAPGQGCAFAPRCPRADARCREVAPPLEAREGPRRVACFYPG